MSRNDRSTGRDPYDSPFTRGMKRIKDPLLAMISGAVAEPISGLAGIATGGNTETVEDMQTLMQYQPDEQGQQDLQSIGDMVQTGMNAVGLEHAPGYWTDETIPALQKQFGTCSERTDT